MCRCERWGNSAAVSWGVCWAFLFGKHQGIPWTKQTSSSFFFFLQRRVALNLPASHTEVTLKLKKQKQKDCEIMQRRWWVQTHTQPLFLFCLAEWPSGSFKSVPRSVLLNIPLPDDCLEEPCHVVPLMRNLFRCFWKFICLNLSLSVQDEERRL